MCIRDSLAFEAWPGDFTPRTRLKFQVITRLAARSAQRIICPSRATAEAVERRYGVDPAELTAPYVIAVGDLRRKKNLAALVAAFGKARRAAELPHRLILAGTDGGDGSRLRTLAGDEPVTFTGYVDDARLDAL